MGGAGAHRTEVADAGGQGADDGGHVELVVVGEHADGVAGTQLVADAVEQAVGPVHHDLVGHREAALRGEHLSGVAHGDAVAEQLGLGGERPGEIDGTEDHHVRAPGVTLHEHAEVHLAGLAVLAVVAHLADARVQHPQRVTLHHPVQVGVAQRAHRRRIRLYEEFGARPRAHIRHSARVWAVDDRRQRNRLLGPDGVPERLVDARSLAHQSSSSTNRWIVPPQVSPTANASSSL